MTTPINPAVARAVREHMEILAHYAPDATKQQAIAKLLGLAADTPLNAVEIEAEVVDITEGAIGADDVSIVSARLDLTTGRLVLTDKELGHPLLVWDKIGTTIHHRRRRYNLPLLAHSVPDGLWRTDVVEHIREHGYWAMLDLRALLQAPREGD